MTASPQRIQLSRRKGWRIPPYTKVVSRPSQWANPFPAATPVERKVAVGRYEEWLHRPENSALKDDAKKLKGFNLACWCPLDGPCHADVLLKLANA